MMRLLPGENDASVASVRADAVVLAQRVVRAVLSMGFDGDRGLHGS
jgi:hypothetical protein